MTARAVIKIGGEVLRDPGQLEAVTRALTGFRAAGVQAVLVHGGGPQANELSERLGLLPVQVEGRRVTDAAAREVAKMVFAGKLNTELVACLVGRGLPAVGLSGIDAGMLRVHRRAPVAARGAAGVGMVDFGFVGDVDGVDATLPERLLLDGFLPVVCSLASDGTAEILNVNADTVAAELAIGLSAQRLVVVTGAGGVYRDAATRTGLCRELDPNGARTLLAQGAAAGGMRPKLAACLRAVEAGVADAWIVDARTFEGALDRSGGAGGGTRVAGGGALSRAS